MALNKKEKNLLQKIKKEDPNPDGQVAVKWVVDTGADMNVLKSLEKKGYVKYDKKDGGWITVLKESRGPKTYKEFMNNE